MNKMKAAVLVEPEKMEIKEIPIPEPGKGWVRIKNKVSGICGSDMHIFTGEHPWLRPGNPMAKYVLGNVYGHEISGVIDAIGEDVKTLNTGEKVGVIAIIPCMKCEYCRVGLYQICKDIKHYGFHYPGGFAEYTLVPAEYLFKIPESLSFEEAAMVDVLVVGVHAVNNASISIADRVAVLGSGPIGLAISSVVLKSGVRDLYVTTSFELQEEILKKIGVKSENLFSIDNNDIKDQILKKTGNRGVDCAIESVGYKADTIKFGLDIIRKGGRIIFTGVFEEPVCINMGDFLIKEATLKASHAFGMWNLVHETELAIEMLSRKEYPVKDIITHSFSLENINDAFFQKMKDPANTLKVVIKF